MFIVFPKGSPKWMAAEQDLEETSSEDSLEKSTLEEGIDVSRSGGPASMTARKSLFG